MAKKEQNEFKNIFEGATNVKALQQKMIKTLKTMKKLTEENNRIDSEREEAQTNIESYKKSIEKSVKTKTMLSKISETFLNQNFDLYETHEKMLDEEKNARAELAASFQDKMNSIQTQMSGQKEERKVEFDKNADLRDKISVAIDAYKAKEEEYKAKMEEHNQNVSAM